MSGKDQAQWLKGKGVVVGKEKRSREVPAAPSGGGLLLYARRRNCASIKDPPEHRHAGVGRYAERKDAVLSSKE